MSQRASALIAFQSSDITAVKLPQASGFRIAVLASGRGSNLAALLDAQAQQLLATEIVAVFSDRAECGAMHMAAQAGIPGWAASPAEFASRPEFDRCMFDRIEAVQPDLIVCAGYMRLISETAVQRFPDRMINIHPSLLPAYPGLRTHARALAAGDVRHGASVHVVIPALDAGQVIARAEVAVREGDTEASLAAKVLEREHPLLVQCVKGLSEGTIRVAGTQIFWNGQPVAQPLLLGPENRLESLT